MEQGAGPNQLVQQGAGPNQLVQQGAGPNQLVQEGAGPNQLVQQGAGPNQLVQQQQNLQPTWRTIWSGCLEWHEKQQVGPDGRLQIILRQLPCRVSAKVTNNEAEVKGVGWPTRLIMQLIPRRIISDLGGTFFLDVKMVLFMLQNCDALSSLTNIVNSGFAGCVRFTGSGSPQAAACTIKILILLYNKEMHAYVGFIPNDPAGFVERLRNGFLQEKAQLAQMRQGQGQGGPGNPGMNSAQAQTQPGGVGPNQLAQQQQNLQGQKRIIWSGYLEWHEEQEASPDALPRQIPCQVLANVKNNEAEVKGDGWPTKLIMRLIPKEYVRDLEGTYLLDVKIVFFMPQNCDALSSLTKFLDSGFAGSVHFIGSAEACTIKFLILLHCKERHTYFGFIPKDQDGFVEHLYVFLHEKAQQAEMRQGQGGPGNPGMNPAQGGIQGGVLGMLQQLGAGQSEPQQQPLNQAQNQELGQGPEVDPKLDRLEQETAECPQNSATVTTIGTSSTERVTVSAIRSSKISATVESSSESGVGSRSSSSNGLDNLKDSKNLGQDQDQSKSSQFSE